MNKLSKESSPYLKQHENNPVDWFPWGDEALEKARSEDKIILLSVGYSACHWCHVMAHESFENEEIASVMNKYFVNIKIDREERPDLDALYMDALQTMGLRGGWPMNVFLLPSTKPFYGGTYFPAKNWMHLLESVQNAFLTERGKLESSADGFAKSLNTIDSVKYGLLDNTNEDSFSMSKEEFKLLNQKLQAKFDLRNGGMQGAPKFPMPSIWQYLSESQVQFESADVLVHLKLSLDRMCLGGLYDHIGGGWTRYSTDERWKVPHFEKMLYDNGQLLTLYASVFELFKTKNVFAESHSLYKWAVFKTIEWLEEEMDNGDSAFYAALDADSEGQEGKYYIWEKSQIESFVLKDSERFKQLYQITENGNWEAVYNILHLENIPQKPDWQLLNLAWRDLKEVRKGRIKPGLDNKVICSWNGLVLSGLLKSYQVFGKQKFLDLALRNANFIANHLVNEIQSDSGKSLASLKHLADKGSILGFLDSYAATINAFTQLYQLTFEEKWLRISEKLMNYCLLNFFDEAEGLFYFTDKQAEELIARKKEIFDNVIPASNSMLAHALYDLGILLSNATYVDLSKSMFSKMKKMLMADPSYLSNWASLALKINQKRPEIVVSGPEAFSKMSLIKEGIKRPAYFCGSEKESSLPLLKNRWPSDGQTLIYVCFNQTCQLPTSSVTDALALINEA